MVIPYVVEGAWRAFNHAGEIPAAPEEATSQGVYICTVVLRLRQYIRACRWAKPVCFFLYSFGRSGSIIRVWSEVAVTIQVVQVVLSFPKVRGLSSGGKLVADNGLLNW